MGRQGGRAHLHNLSLLLDQPFKTVQQLNRYRKELSRELAETLAPANEAHAS